MFQQGGTVTYADGTTSQFDTATFRSKIENLPDAEVFALTRNAIAGNLIMSPELFDILKNSPLFTPILVEFSTC